MGCYNSCVVNAPVANVWSALRELPQSFVGSRCHHVRGSGRRRAGTQVGARRILNGAFHETLLALDDAAREFSYSIDDGPDAVSKANVTGYIGSVRVRPITDRDATFVEWSSSWQDSKGGVQEFCDPIYRALLDAMKKHFDSAR